MTTESTLMCSMCTMFYMNLGNQVTVRGAIEKNKRATTKVGEKLMAQIWGCTSAMPLVNCKEFLASEAAAKWGELLAPGSCWATLASLSPGWATCRVASALLILLWLDQSSMDGRHHRGNTHRRRLWQCSSQPCSERVASVLSPDCHSQKEGNSAQYLVTKSGGQLFRVGRNKSGSHTEQAETMRRENRLVLN